MALVFTNQDIGKVFFLRKECLVRTFGRDLPHGYRTKDEAVARPWVLIHVTHDGWGYVAMLTTRQQQLGGRPVLTRQDWGDAAPRGNVYVNDGHIFPILPIEADAWANGVIAGKDMRLADLLAELARYRPGHITCDPRVAGLRVSGLYHVKDTDQALQFLLQTQPVSVVYTTRFWVSVGPDSGA